MAFAFVAPAVAYADGSGANSTNGAAAFPAEPEVAAPEDDGDAGTDAGDENPDEDADDEPDKEPDEAWASGPLARVVGPASINAFALECPSRAHAIDTAHPSANETRFIRDERLDPPFRDAERAGRVIR